MKRYINSIKHLKNWLSFWKFYYSIKNTGSQPKNFIAFFRTGKVAEVPSELMSAFDEIFLREIYNLNFHQISNDPIILDLGANVGYFSIFLSCKLPRARLIAFEPLHSNFLLLKKHKDLNNLKYLELDERAVLGIGRSISIKYNRSQKYSVGASFLNRKDSDETVVVSAISIPEIFIEYKMNHCDLLKIDCEGAEYNIIQNCPAEYLKKINHMVIEVHRWVSEKEGTVEELISFLKQHNFKVKFHNKETLWCWK